MISREQYVVQSVQEYAKHQLFEVREYDETRVEVLDEFPVEQIEGTEPPDKNSIATGFNFTDQGKPLEMGSNTKIRIYTIEFFVFGLDGTAAENIATQLQTALEADGFIPLLDISDPERPQFDSMEVLGASSQREPVSRPRPWERYIWSATCKVEDIYDPAAV